MPEELAKLYDLSVNAFMARSVQIDRSDLKGEFCEVAAQFAYWNERYAEAQRASSMASLELKQLMARAHAEERARLIEEAPLEEVGTGKNVRERKKLPNADDVNNAVEGRSDVQTQRNALVEAEVECQRLQGVCTAVRTKKDMLIAYGSMVREEMKGDPSIREEAREEEFARRERGGGWRQNGGESARTE